MTKQDRQRGLNNEHMNSYEVQIQDDYLTLTISYKLTFKRSYDIRGLEKEYDFWIEEIMFKDFEIKFNQTFMTTFNIQRSDNNEY